MVHGIVPATKKTHCMFLIPPRPMHAASDMDYATVDGRNPANQLIW